MPSGTSRETTFSTSDVPGIWLYRNCIDRHLAYRAIWFDQDFNILGSNQRLSLFFSKFLFAIVVVVLFKSPLFGSRGKGPKSCRLNVSVIHFLLLWGGLWPSLRHATCLDGQHWRRREFFFFKTYLWLATLSVTCLKMWGAWKVPYDDDDSILIDFLANPLDVSFFNWFFVFTCQLVH